MFCRIIVVKYRVAVKLLSDSTVKPPIQVRYGVIKTEKRGPDKQIKQIKVTTFHQRCFILRV